MLHIVKESGKLKMLTIHQMQGRTARTLYSVEAGCRVLEWLKSKKGADSPSWGFRMMYMVLTRFEMAEIRIILCRSCGANGEGPLAHQPMIKKQEPHEGEASDEE